MNWRMVTSEHLAPLLIRTGLAIVFLYAAISSFINPTEWIGYFPPFLTDLIPSTILLPVFSLYELGLALWLLSGFYSRYAGIVAALTLAGIVVTNFSLFAISFRDIGLIFTAIALACMKEKTEVKNHEA